MVGTAQGRLCPPYAIDCHYNGAALSPCALDSFEANDASTITTEINPITMVQIALISGFTPRRTSE